MRKVKGKTNVRIRNLVRGGLMLVTASLIQLSAPIKGFAWEEFGCMWCTSEFNERSNAAYEKYLLARVRCEYDTEEYELCLELAEMEYQFDIAECERELAECRSDCEY